MADIENVMERLGKILAADRDLKVHVRGRQAFAEKGAVTIPSIETFDDFDATSERLLHGLLDHECGHAMDTDFDQLKRCEDKPAGLKGLWNALEDGYIEARMARRYPGCAYNFRIKNEWFWSTSFPDARPAREVIADESNLLQGLLMAITLYVREHGGLTVDQVKEASPTVADLLKFVQPEVDEVRALVDKPSQTSAILDIAERIWAKLMDAIDQGDGECAELPPTPVAGEGESDAQGGTEIPDKLPTREDMEGESFERPTPEATATVHVERLGSDEDYVVYSHEWDLEWDFSRGDLTHLQHQAEELEHATRNAADALIFTFETALKALREKRAVPGSDEGEVDPTVLAEYALGSLPADQMYKQYLAEDDRDVAVSVLVDCSGSMSHYDYGGSKRGEQATRAEHARRAAFAISAALQRCQIPVEVSGFTTVSDYAHGHPWVTDANRSYVRRNREDAMQALSHPKAKCSRTNEHAGMLPMHAVFSGFSTDDLRGLHYIEAIDQNLDGEAVLWAARRLGARPEARRVMFVLSDGEPAGAHSGDDDEYLRKAVTRVLESGLEVYGLGIQSSSVRRYYPRYWVTHDLDDLCDLAMDAMSDVLLEGRREGAWLGLTA